MLLCDFEGDHRVRDHLIGEWLGLGVEELHLFEWSKHVLGDGNKLT